MLFNSYEFIFAFLPVTLFLYFYLNHKRQAEAAKGFLVFSSLVFYSWWNIACLPIMLASMLFNYIMGTSLNKDRGEGHRFSKKSLLTFGVVLNLALLGYFKYMGLFIENINLESDSELDLLHLALPLAISFFTFQQITYLVDSYRQEIKEHNFINYTLFVTFFPQLIAGPIVRYGEMMPHFADIKNSVKNYKNIAMGLFVFSIGLFKKVVIADAFSIWATQGFDVAATLSLFGAWATSLSYTFQLYFDFSGYTDMAIGTALLFNIKLPINFNSPYKATNVQDFWRRWHITLSRFLRDYIYIPLGGNRKGEFRTYTNLMATFIIGGIWHGAGWTFVFWGGLHGMALVVQRAWSKLGFKIWTWLAWLITFNFVNIAWVFFRAKEWGDAIRVLSSMFSLDNIVLNPLLQNNLSLLSQYGITFGGMFEDIGGDRWTFVLLLVTLIFILIFKSSTQKLGNFKLNHNAALLSGLAFVGGVLSLNKVSEFLYFIF